MCVCGWCIVCIRSCFFFAPTFHFCVFGLTYTYQNWHWQSGHRHPKVMERMIENIYKWGARTTSVHMDRSISKGNAPLVQTASFRVNGCSSENGNHSNDECANVCVCVCIQIYAKENGFYANECKWMVWIDLQVRVEGSTLSKYTPSAE